jgi:hypothetical protein
VRVLGRDGYGSELTDISRFSLRPWGPFPLVGYAELRDGRSVHMLGVAAPNPITRPNNQTAQRMIAQLNEPLDHLRPRA